MRSSYLKPLTAVELYNKYKITRPQLIDALMWIESENLNTKGVLDFYETVSDVRIHNLVDKIINLASSGIPVICYKNTIFEIVYYKGVTPTDVKKDPSDYIMLFRVTDADFALNHTVLIYPRALHTPIES